MSNPTPINTTPAHARLRPFSPSGFTTNNGQNTTDGGVLSSPKQNNNSSSTRTFTESREVPSVRVGVQMLRDRGVDAAAALVDQYGAEMIVRVCQWNDRQKNAGPGLIVWKLRQGGVPADDVPVNKVTRMRDVFDRYLQAHPVGSRLCSHAQLSARKWPDDRETCPGQMLVVEASYPVLEMECDACGLDAALTPRAMKEFVS